MDPIFDKNIYGPSNKFEGYKASIALDSDEEEEEKCYARRRDLVQKMSSYTAPKHLISELQKQGNEDGNLRKNQRIIDRENDYRKRRLNRKLSPPRYDPFAAGDTSPDASASTYADVMREQAVKRLEHETYRLISEKRKDRDEGFGEKRKDRDEGFGVRAKENKDKYAEKKRRRDEHSDLKESKFSQEKIRVAHSSARRRS